MSNTSKSLAIDVSAETQNTAVPLASLHIPALDGLRGVAILLVVFYHLANSLEGEFGYGNLLLSVAKIGWIGVDLFFVLSGFLITGILYDSKTSKSTNYFKKFYMRRLLRIFPLYYGILVLFAIYYTIWPNSGLHGHDNPAWIWIFMTNFVMSWGGAFGVLDHFWSLAVEEHFYLVWPLTVFLFSRRRLMQLAVALFFLSFGLRIALLLGGTSNEAIYLLTPTRLDALSIGAFLALATLTQEGARKLVGPSWLMGIASGFGIIAIIIIRQTVNELDTTIQVLGYSLIAVFSSATLLLSITTPIQKVFNLGILRWFGKYSFGIYVFHPIIFIQVFHTDLARALRFGNGAVDMIVSVCIAMGVTIAVTLVSWHFWESQFLKLKRYFV